MDKLTTSVGAVYIELAFTVGLIAAIFLWSIDLNLMLETRGQMSILSRETAVNVFRSCRQDAYESDDDAYEVRACLREARSRSMLYARTMDLANDKLPDPILVDDDGEPLNDQSGQPLVDQFGEPLVIPQDDKLDIIVSLYRCAVYNCSGDCAPDATNSSCSCDCSGIERLGIQPDPSEELEQLLPKFPSRYTADIVASKMNLTMKEQEQIIIVEIVKSNDGLSTITDGRLMYEETIF